jgi:hypothetical protein
MGCQLIRRRRQLGPIGPLQDHIHVHDLLDRAGLPSLNALSVKATATVAWRAYHSDDGGDGQRNPLGLLLFGPRLGECHVLSYVC